MLHFFIGKFFVKSAQAAVNRLDPKPVIFFHPELPIPSVQMIKRMAKTVARINTMEPETQKLTDEGLRLKTDEFRKRYQDGMKEPFEELRRIEDDLKNAPPDADRQDQENRLSQARKDLKKARRRVLDGILPEAFAVAREAGLRFLNMRHFDVQLVGGMSLHEGNISEMSTGEGKTLVATLAAYLNALADEGVHVVTVNDYLARRDRDWMGPLYEALGLTVGVIQHDMDAQERRAAYGSDITYGTNNEFGFDYLRDNMVGYKEEMVQRGHHFAIVDEVDSILIDEARTPLIISGPAEESTDKYYRANEAAIKLKGRRITEREEIEAKYKNVDLTTGYDYLADEKNKSVSLTEPGEEKTAKLFGVANLHDMDTIEYRHHILQALKAKEFFKADVDYVVRDGEVIIVDEFTGRLMPGRRWSDGLHQAVEAKEGIKIERENQTLATITFQNYFRMYEKLSGMTGTAYTEANEFKEIYNLDCVVIPTNRPLKRINHTDCIYKTRREKFEAVVMEIEACHKHGQPALVGTISIEKSELLSSMLKKKGIPHQVLNAKYHELEAQIVAQAGRFKGVTIATNMAGRGTDILLGGNAEFLARSLAETQLKEVEDAEQRQATVKKFLEQFREQVKKEHDQVVEAGGLHVIGTERHESRRIDNQLRGRSGRQGDPGSSRFYVSLEDDLMRLFGSERIMGMMERLGMEEGQVIEHPWVSKSLEVAQKRVETHNFEIRKQLLEYDNVMNKQREAIYGLRRAVLVSGDVKDRVLRAIEDEAFAAVSQHIFSDDKPEEWDIEGLEAALKTRFNLDISAHREAMRTSMTRPEIEDLVMKGMLGRYEAKEQEIPPEHLRRLERIILLNNIDAKWKEHLYAMDQLKEGVGLRAYGQRDPLIEYKREGYKMFQEMYESVNQEVVETLFKIQAVARDQERPRNVFASMPWKFVHKDYTSLGSSAPAPSAGPQMPDMSPKPVASPQPIHKSGPKVGRNDPCPCGSGKKYKKCCGA
ncbi:MAG: preprotein translocase subunit SecA [Candidatus Omnitrophota bacterium]|nr:preprotein translocase subunit SecA [Candidatus Omnitrophota bacterium]MDZ4241589.1 preprotein translocase subunit SecA [Candidatus Omnitrophota bacterium]